MIKKYKFSILVALVILYLSLANSHTFDKVPVFNIPYFDKIVHFGMYFGLMLMIIIENRRSVRSIKHLFSLSLIPLFYGIIIEIMQSFLTVTRSGNFYDAIADLAGILVSVLIFTFIKPLKKEIFREK
jgi:VanZ family protein